MRFIIIHNRYSKIGGEESVVAQQEKLLKDAGHCVMLYQRSYEEISDWKFGKITSFFSALYNRKSLTQLKKIIDQFKPDVALVHNLFPVISPAVLPLLKKNKIKVIMTVHNYRLICPTGLFFNKGRICEKCSKGVRELNCLINNCQGTFFGSFSHFFRAFYARVTKKYIRNVDVFMVLSQFQKNKLISCGIDEQKISIVPNFFQPPKCDKIEKDDISNSEDYVGFVGRLSPEKGVELLFEVAKKMPQVKFKLAGGVAQNYVLPQIPNNVTLCGHLEKRELVEFIKNANIIISTSICYEGGPISILEAMFYKKCVVVPDNAVFPEITDNGKCGVMYEFATSSDCVDNLSKVLADKKLSNRIGISAHNQIVFKYSPQKYLDAIIEIANRI